MRELRRRALLVLRRSELHESLLLRPSMHKRLCVPYFILRCWPVFNSVEQLFVLRRLSFWAFFSAIKRCLCNVLPSWVLREWCAVRELSTRHIHKRQQCVDCVRKLCGRQLLGVDIGIRMHSLSDGNIRNCCWSYQLLGVSARVVFHHIPGYRCVRVHRLCCGEVSTALWRVKLSELYRGKVHEHIRVELGFRLRSVCHREVFIVGRRS